MDRTIGGIVARLNADPEQMRELEKKRMTQVYVDRYLGSPTHEWFGNLSLELGTVKYSFAFTESDNSALIATYDFYLGRDVWFQICYHLDENGTAILRVSDRDGHKEWGEGELSELWEYIISAYKNPKTTESVTG